MTLEIIYCLVKKLNSEEITYCHWKSNRTLTKALSGQTDLDFLVDRRSLPKMTTILLKLGYKSAVVRYGSGTPTVSHFYGFDPQSSQLTHVHLFNKVITGESFVKSHLFPFEGMLFENVCSVDEIKVTSKAAELTLFILRMFIKHGSLLDLLYLHKEPKTVQEELHWLLSKCDLSEVLSLLEKYCPVVDNELFINCVESLKGNSSLLKRIFLAKQVRRRLRIYARHNSYQRFRAYAYLLWGQIKRRLNGNKKNKMLQSGGAIIAFVGTEATGKSTLVSESCRWLGGVFAVSTIHAGKPPSSWFTKPVNMLLPLARTFLPRLRNIHLEEEDSSSNHAQSQLKSGLSSLIYALRGVTLAWDRRKLLVKARRSASNGEIVICDRYPSHVLGAMDSRRLHPISNQHGVITAIYNWLVHLEAQMYKQIPPPDIVLRLHVSVEIAKTRNRERIKPGKETDTYIEARHHKNQAWYMPGTQYVYDISTERPLVDTILDVKKAIWESL